MKPAFSSSSSVTPPSSSNVALYNKRQVSRRVTADKKYWRKPLAVMDLAQIVANVDTFRAEWLEAAGAQDVFGLFCHRRCLLELVGEFLCLVGLKDQA